MPRNGFFFLFMAPATRAAKAATETAAGGERTTDVGGCAAGRGRGPRVTRAPEAERGGRRGPAHLAVPGRKLRTRGSGDFRPRPGAEARRAQERPLVARRAGGRAAPRGAQARRRPEQTHGDPELPGRPRLPRVPEAFPSRPACTGRTNGPPPPSLSQPRCQGPLGFSPAATQPFGIALAPGQALNHLSRAAHLSGRVELVSSLRADSVCSGGQTAAPALSAQAPGPQIGHRSLYRPYPHSPPTLNIPAGAGAHPWRAN